MFCPNCGTQNPDAAQTCSKCNFHLKSAAAPKFKGTMLMLNQPGAAPGALPVPPGPAVGPAAPAGPPPPAAAPGHPLPGAPPAGAGHLPSRLKGTMVGVAPMAGGMPPVPVAPFGGAGKTIGSAPPPPPFASSPPHLTMQGAASFSPPVPQAGVNPLGGTMAADAGVFAAMAAQQQPAPPPAHAPLPLPPMGATALMAPGAGGAPPMYPPFPAPGGGPPPFTANAPAPGGFPPFAPPTPAPQGGPPFGGPPPLPPFAAPGGYGQGQAQPPPAFGTATPPMGGGQAPPAALVPHGAAGGMLGTLKSPGTASGPTRRNPVMTLVLPFAVMFGGIVLSILLGLINAALTGLGSLVMLAGAVWYLLIAIQMVAELRSVTRSEALAWWPLIVPFYNLYFMWVVVPQEVTKAKQALAVRQPLQAFVLYVLLWPYALASDLNDLVR